jgi:hypothetical protein
MKKENKLLLQTVGLILILILVVYILYLLGYNMKGFVYEQF